MNLIISNSSKEPIYQQIYNQVKEEILTNNLKEGEKLPSIRYLAKELRISVITTKRAYDELERDGFLTTVPGKGTFVGKQNLDLIREEFLKDIEASFTSAIEKAGLIDLSLEDLKLILETLYREG